MAPYKITLNSVTILLSITVLVYFASNSIDLTKTFALYFPQNENFAAWQFVTYMFMHGSLTHLFFNMFALWMFGTQLEAIWGGKRFVFFYFVCGIGAALIYTAINTYEFNNIYSLFTEAELRDFDIKSMIDRQVYPPYILLEEQAIELINTSIYQW